LNWDQRQRAIGTFHHRTPNFPPNSFIPTIAGCHPSKDAGRAPYDASQLARAIEAETGVPQKRSVARRVNRYVRCLPSQNYGRWCRRLFRHRRHRTAHALLKARNLKERGYAATAVGFEYREESEKLGFAKLIAKTAPCLSG